MIHQKVDYILAGAGLAGSTLLRKMISSGVADQKKILVIDREFSLKNDKTWCFWTDDDPFAIQHAFKRWSNIGFRSSSDNDIYRLTSHHYYGIKSEDYLSACHSVFDTVSNIQWLQADIQGFDLIDGSAVVLTDKGVFGATYIFQSCLQPASIPSNSTPIHLIQHFLGWEINTQSRVFDTDVAILMDFRTTQEFGFAFVYVLPYSQNQALIELTYFTESLFPSEQYQAVLRHYIREQFKVDYTIERVEFGIIPMETTLYTTWWCPGVLNMGLAGGQCKASTGYTFSRISRFCDDIVDALKRDDLSQLNSGSPYRFRWYDRAMLWLLKHRPQLVPEIFLRLFRRNKADRMLDFLDEKTSFFEEIGIFYTTRWRYFIEAILKSLK